MNFNQSLFDTTPNKVVQTVISVSELNKSIAKLIEKNCLPLWISGEISNLTKASSGHWYFSIKDKTAAVRAVMFKFKANSLSFEPELGRRYEFYVQPSLYEPRGDYQVRVENMRMAGKGDLYEDFLRLRDKLTNEGLIDPSKSKPLPSMPKAIGVITSLNAAALQDVLSVLNRRAKYMPVIIYPTQVQGDAAIAQLKAALTQAINRKDADILLLVRGGGSIEDLWCFNDEQLARLIASSPIPVISGVGHETDFTIADFVADLRAPTPTAAAELCCTSEAELLKHLNTEINNLHILQRRYLDESAMRLDKSTIRLVSPLQRLQLQKHKLITASDKITNALQNNIYTQKHRLDNLCQTLQALNPLAVLDRGYAIVRNSNGQLVKNALDLKITETIDIEFGLGKAQAEVLKTDAIH